MSLVGAIRCVGWVLAGTCLVGVFTVHPVARWASPEYAVVVSGQCDQDPWGEPWQLAGGGDMGTHHPALSFRYCKGPDRKDQGGFAGDDILYIVAMPNVLGANSYGTWWFAFVTSPAATLGSVALLLAWLLRLWPALTRPQAGVRRELVRAAEVVVPPVLLFYAGAELLRADYFWGDGVKELERLLRPLSVSSAPVVHVAVGSAAVLCYLIALAFRLRRPDALAASISEGSEEASSGV